MVHVKMGFDRRLQTQTSGFYRKHTRAVSENTW
jgi:hypothetical protein